VSRRADPRLIGLFVLGALAVAVAGVVAFGGSGLFDRGDRYTVHFDESLKGLRVGAPVTFRGVEVGQVREIRAVYDPASGAVQVPVVVELRPGALSMGDGSAPAGPADDVIPDLVDHGLRARLDLQSIVTGQLLVSLDFHGRPAGAAAADPVPPPGEIPSIRSTWAGLQRTVDEAVLNAPEIARTMKELTAALRDLVTGPTGDSLRQGVVSLSALLQGLGDPGGPLARTMAELPALAAGLRAATERLPALAARLESLAEASERLVNGGDARLQTLGEEAGRLAVSLGRAADQASALIRENREGLEEFTADGLPQLVGLVEDANRMVNELNGAIRDMRQDPARFFLGDRAAQGVRLD
jgi:paraquat-inducible protein B